MNKEIINWDTILGYRSIRWGSIEGGIIYDEPIWDTEVPIGLCFGRLLIFGDNCYVQGDDFVIYSIRMATGEINWSCKLPDDLLCSESFSGTEDYLLNELYVIDIKTGQIHADIRDYIDDIPLIVGQALEMKKDFLYRQINSEEAPGAVLVFNISLKESKIINTGMYNLCMPQDDIIYGWRLNADNFILSKYDLKNNKLSTVNTEIGVGRLFAEGDHLLTISETEIVLLDLKQESITWKRSIDSLSDHLDPDDTQFYSPLICEDTIGIFNSGILVFLNRKDGETLWEKEVEELLEVCISGDLIYGISGYKFKNEKRLFALDRYTGEVQWEKNADQLINKVKSFRNNVIFSSVSGHITCYQWNKNAPYHSPAKPKATLEA